MIIGVPKEIKNNENRTSITPAGVMTLVQAGHRVLVEKSAGAGSGINDNEYLSAGAEILACREGLFDCAEMIVKVKEPLTQEYHLFRRGQVLFTYLHLAADPGLARALVERGVVGIAYETVQRQDGSLPLLTPMSQIAGRMAPQIGARLLENANLGKGVLMGGVPGVPPARVTILGGGTVGTNAAKVALGMGALVTILDVNLERLAYLDDVFQGHVTTLVSNAYNIAGAVKNCDLLIGAVLIPGAKAPRLVTDEMVRGMSPGSVIVDVAIDQGGSIETVDRATTHDAPFYVKHDVVHYSVANIPGTVARTSTFALSNATLPYIVSLANKGYKRAIAEDPSLDKGVNILDGRVVHPVVAEAVQYTV